MRKSSFLDTCERFFYWIHWYDSFLRKIYHTKQVTLETEEKKEIFEAFALRIYSLWESIVEDLLIDCLNRDTSKYANSRRIDLPKHLTRNVCEQLITGLGYFDFRDTGNLKGKAKQILVDKYNPFARIDKDDADRIDEFLKIRNYLAHYSRHSERALLNMYKSKYGFNKFREPGDFLFARSRNTHEARLFGYITAFFNAADKMAIFLGM